MRVAAWQYPIDAVGSMTAWHAKLDAAVAEAASAGARLLVVPEYASMELTSVLPATEQADLATQLAGMQRLLAEYDRTYRAVAARHAMTIVAGSFPVQAVEGAYHNRALVVGATGEVVVEKLQMTRFERERWGISAGRAQAVVDLGGGVRLGVAICYDAEFPLIVRRLVDAGANVIAVPSCTDGLAGYYRVRVACQARALENQCYVVQAPTVGIAPWSIAVDENVGAAAIYGPSDHGFPADGVVAIGALDAPALVIAELDVARVEEARTSGQVLVHRDWDAPAHHAGVVEQRRLAR